MKNSGTIRVLIVEDQEVVRIGLGLSLESHPEIEVINEAADGIAAVNQAVSLKPDVILMDIGLPKMDGIAAATLIKKELPARIIMFTDHDDDQSVFAAMSAGADGYCLKDVSGDQLVKAIKTVADGAVWLDERVAGRVLRSYETNSPASPQPEVEAKPEKSPAQQLDVLSLMVEGLNADQISAKLALPLEDVNTCLYDVVEKLSKSERAQAALADLRKEMFKDVPGLTKWCPVCQRDLDPMFDVCPWDGASLDRASEEHLIGTTFADRYEISELLGKGGMGIVYKARHKFMNRQVAIKILHPFLLADLNNMKRFRQEAEATSALQHPNVIQIFDFGLTNMGEAFLVMEFLQGTSLDALLDKVDVLPVDRAVDIFLQCCDALEHAHGHNIIHRDLKPSNVVLINEGDKSEFVKLVDFGIAKFTTPERNANFTQDQTVRGSPGYMSPEQCQALHMDTRSDIYSFGCVMYETLVGSPPFPADNAIDAMYMHCRSKPEPICSLMPAGTIPEELDKIILKALAKNPAHRQQTIAELKEELMPFRSAKYAVN